MTEVQRPELLSPTRAVRMRPPVPGFVEFHLLKNLEASLSHVLLTSAGAKSEERPNKRLIVGNCHIYVAG
jgi:hypothetical protein